MEEFFYDIRFVLVCCEKTRSVMPINNDTRHLVTRLLWHQWRDLFIREFFTHCVTLKVKAPRSVQRHGVASHRTSIPAWMLHGKWCSVLQDLFPSSHPNAESRQRRLAVSEEYQAVRHCDTSAKQCHCWQCEGNLASAENIGRVYYDAPFCVCDRRLKMALAAGKWRVEKAERQW
jgi:hypothetical protein